MPPKVTKKGKKSTAKTSGQENLSPAKKDSVPKAQDSVPKAQDPVPKAIVLSSSSSKDGLGVETGTSVTSRGSKSSSSSDSSSDESSSGGSGISSNASKQGTKVTAPGSQTVVSVLKSKKKKLSTFLTPYQADFDPHTKEGLFYFEKATQPPPGWKQTSINPSNRVQVLDAIRWMVEKWGITCLNIPTSGDGSVAARSKKFANAKVANFALGDYINVLDEHSRRLKDGEYTKYSRWMCGDHTSRFAFKADDKMVLMAIDPNEKGNRGLVNQAKLRLRRESAILYAFLANLVSFSDFTQFRLLSSECTYQHEENPVVKHKCGVILFHLFKEALHPMTKISVDHLENKLAKETLAQHKGDLVAYLTATEDFRLRIEAERGVKYDEDRYMTRIFSDLNKYKQEDFQSDLRAEKRSWLSDGKKMGAVLESLRNTYKNLREDGTWTRLTAKDQAFVALTTKIKKLEKRLADDGTSAGGDKPNPKTPSGGGGAPGWMITKVGHHTKHPETGETMVWCDKHKSKNGVVNGMYMKAPHDHDEWLAKRVQRSKEYRERASNKRKAGRDAGGDDKKGSKSKDKNKDHGGTSKMALSKSFMAGLATTFSCNDAEAKAFFDAHYDEAVATETQSKE